ncbi:hypothetical protein KFK09_024035 [Dendrobium nobile]|uniref:Uncharacterized protein n=1 Tax=Dendrobium nobile TaxID=94219 RepID=A0A8T3ACR5_DENNO|nr:hypothetical protein KFK09_024035 [Dendrobium nobile]
MIGMNILEGSLAISCRCILNPNSSSHYPICITHYTSDVCGNVSKENFVTFGVIVE